MISLNAESQNPRTLLRRAYNFERKKNSKIRSGNSKVPEHVKEMKGIDFNLQSKLTILMRIITII